MQITDSFYTEDIDIPVDSLVGFGVYSSRWRHILCGAQ